MKTILLRAASRFSAVFFRHQFNLSSAVQLHPMRNLQELCSTPAVPASAASRSSRNSQADPQAHLWKATQHHRWRILADASSGPLPRCLSSARLSSRANSISISPAGNRAQLDLRLDLERLSSSVVVTAQAEPTPIQQTTASVTVITRAGHRSAPVRHASRCSALRRRASPSAEPAPKVAPLPSFSMAATPPITKVLVDGTPVNDPGNAVDFSNFTLDNVDKVEIVRGAESAIYGTDAVSGVIQVFTHRGTTRIPGVQRLRRRRKLRHRPRRRATQRPARQFRLLRRRLLFLHRRAAGPERRFSIALSPEISATVSATTISSASRCATTPATRKFPAKLCSSRPVSTPTPTTISSAPMPAGILPPASTGITRSWAPNPTTASSPPIRCKVSYATDPAAFCPQDQSVRIRGHRRVLRFHRPDSQYQYNRASLNASPAICCPISAPPLATNTKSKTPTSPFSLPATSAATIRPAFSISAIALILARR